MRNRIKAFRTRPSRAVSHIDLDVIEEDDEDGSKSEFEFFKSMECRSNRRIEKKARRRVQNKQKSSHGANWIPEVLSDSDEDEDDEVPKIIDEDDKENYKKQCEELNKQFDSFDDFSMLVETEEQGIRMTWDSGKGMRPLSEKEILEKERNERIWEDRTRKEVVARTASASSSEEWEGPKQILESARSPKTPPRAHLSPVRDLRTCLGRLSQMTRRRDAGAMTPRCRRTKPGEAAGTAHRQTLNILDELMKSPACRLQLQRTPAAARASTVASQPIPMLPMEEEDEGNAQEERATVKSRTRSQLSSEPPASRAIRSTRTMPAEKRTDKGTSVAETEMEEALQLLSDSEDDQEELVGIDEAHSARLLEQQMTAGIGDGAEPMLHSTPIREVASQEARRPSARFSRLAGMSPIRRRNSARVEEEEREKKDRENEERCVVKLSEKLEEELAEELQKSMTLRKGRPSETTTTASNATAQATLLVGGDTVAGGGTMLYGEDTVAGTTTLAGCGDGTLAEQGATMTEEAASCLHQLTRRTTVGGESTIDVSMASVESVFAPMPGNVSRARNVSQIANESCFGKAMPFYLHNFDGGTALQQLLHVIGQEAVGGWRQQLPSDTLETVRKLGEGTYGEVFSTRMNGVPVAMKVIPFSDDVINVEVNEEFVKTTAEILPEVLITRELSDLSNKTGEFSTSTFIELVQCHVVKGKYPTELLREWDAYNKRKTSENQRPSTYAGPDSLFLAIGLAMGGVDVESYKMRNEKEAISAIIQVALALVVAENQLEFEHRDLHIGNVLIAQVPKNEEVSYRISGNTVKVKSCGVKLSIIDFTNSRMRKEGTTIFVDLESDEQLFIGEGDYQFDIYRLMRQHNKGDWRSFCPKSNVLWLHYLARNLILEEKRERARGFSARRRKELFALFDPLPNFDTVLQFLNTDEMHELMQEYATFEGM